MIAAINRGDRHHRWAVTAIAAARQQRARLVVPEVVAGEAFTKLRYDRQVSGRRDSRPALALFGLLAAAPEVFGVIESPPGSYDRAQSLLHRYVDQTYSYVDAIVLLTADDDRAITSLWTVDSSLSAYRFSHPVTVEMPQR